MLFDFDDIVLIPTELSNINSRKEVNTYTENNFLPLMTAPMDTVIKEDIINTFLGQNIISVLPRRKEYKEPSWGDVVSYSNNGHYWYSYSIEQFKQVFLTAKRYSFRDYLSDCKYYALIDVANGHMQQLYDVAKKAKELYGDDLVLMIGNIANPNTFVKYAKIGVDYIRCGIGNGGACLTTQQTGVGYPMGSLISEISQLKKGSNYKTKIVADGGFKKYADVIKALALGADYVMLGSIFNKALTSIHNTYILEDGNYIQLSNYLQSLALDEVEAIALKSKVVSKALKQGILYKPYRGMSTKEVQESWGKDELKTSEGISTFQQVEYTLEGWCQNFKDYLASAMSYTGSYNLEEFKNSKYELITPAAFKRYNK